MSVRGVDLRTPPHSIEAEQAVLGGLLLDSQSWDNVADVLRGDDFYRKDHRLIFESIGALAAQGQPCDAVTVSESLERHGQLAEAGGLAYLAGLTRDTPTAANVRVQSVAAAARRAPSLAPWRWRQSQASSISRALPRDHTRRS